MIENQSRLKVAEITSTRSWSFGVCLALMLGVGIALCSTNGCGLPEPIPVAPSSSDIFSPEHHDAGLKSDASHMSDLIPILDRDIPPPGDSGSSIGSDMLSDGSRSDGLPVPSDALGEYPPVDGYPWDKTPTAELGSVDAGLSSDILHRD
jgi:hypothetical protein